MENTNHTMDAFLAKDSVLPFARKSTQTKAEEFERIEDKVLIPSQHTPELMELLNHEGVACDLVGDTKFSMIESVYYDSSEYQSFRDHFQSKYSRFKLRTRRYAPGNGEFSHKIHLELKYKQGEVSHKFRFRLTPQDLRALNEGKPIRISDALLAKNEKINAEELSYRLSIINLLVDRYKLVPVLKIIYNRNAFEAKGIRLTVDTNIRSQLLNSASSANLFGSDAMVYENAMAMAAKFDTQKFSLLEVKHKGSIPTWLNAFLEQKGLLKTSFSKYCYSLTTQVNEGAKLNAVS